MKRLLFLILLLIFSTQVQAGVLVFSPNGTFTAKTTLTAASTAADVVGKKVVVTSAQTLSSNLTWPSDRALAFERGGVVTIATGVTLTIPFMPQAGNYQIFNCQGTGKVVFTNGADIPLKWFGATGDGTTDDASTIQAAITSASASRLPISVPAGKYVIKSTLTTPASGFIHLKGGFGVLPQGNTLTDPTKASTFYYAPTSGTTMLDLGNNCFFSFEGMAFVSSDATAARIGIAVGILGNLTSQTAADGQFIIQRNYFSSWGAGALHLGGETYGKLKENSFHNNVQAIAINGAGEIDLSGNIFLDVNSTAFTPGTGNKDGFIVIVGTVVNINNHNNIQSSELARPFIYLSECTNINLVGNKFETPGLATLSVDYIKIENSSVAFKSIAIESNAMTASSLNAGAHTGRFITTYGSIIGEQLSISKNTLTFSTSVTSAVPCIDVTTNKPRIIHLSGNYREGSDNALIKVTSGVAADSTTLLGGIKSDQISYITVRTPEFTISASQTGTICNIGGAKQIMNRSGRLAQYIPVAMDIQNDGNPTGVVSFYLGVDVSKLDKISFTSTQRNGYKYYPLRDIYTPTLSTGELGDGIYYDSDGSVSTTVKYVATITYAVIEDGSAASGQLGMINAI